MEVMGLRTDGVVVALPACRLLDYLNLSGLAFLVFIMNLFCDKRETLWHVKRKKREQPAGWERRSLACDNGHTYFKYFFLYNHDMMHLSQTLGSEAIRRGMKAGADWHLWYHGFSSNMFRQRRVLITRNLDPKQAEYPLPLLSLPRICLLVLFGQDLDAILANATRKGRV